MDYLDIISPNQGADVFGQFVPRARLGPHLRLARLLEKTTFDDVKETAQTIKEYLELAGADVVRLSGFEQLRAFLVLTDLNRLQTHLAFLRAPGDPKYKEPTYTYPSRSWALWVHKLASRYGWGRNEIFNLWPEEAAVYIQEIILAEYDEADERRALSELAYRYDKVTKESIFIPTPRPGWMIEKAEPVKMVRVRKDMLPIGHIIKLDEMTNDDFEFH